MIVYNADWDYMPLTRDETLDIFGGFSKTDEITDLIWQGIRNELEDIVGPFEVCGLLLSTFNISLGRFDLKCLKKEIYPVLDYIAQKSNYTSEMNELVDDFDTEMILSASSIPFEERKKLLVCAMHALKGVIERHVFESEFQVLVKPTPGAKHSGVYKWIDNVEDDTESKWIQKVYNLAAETVASNFSNVTNPMTLSTSDLEWIMEQHENFEDYESIRSYKKWHPAGITVTLLDSELNSENVLVFDNKTLDTVTLQYLKYITDAFDRRNIAWEGISTTEDTLFIRAHFGKGFIAVKFYNGISLYSIDLNRYIQDGRDKVKAIFSIETIKLLSKIVPVKKGTMDSVDKLIKSANTGNTANTTNTDNRTNTANTTNTTNTDNRTKVKQPGIYCTYKYRNKQGIITGYRLAEIPSGNTRDVKASILKQYIKEGKITVLNLKLTPDGKLINKN